VEQKREIEKIMAGLTTTTTTKRLSKVEDVE